ncbi:MAG: response regulator [Spirochaetaceae bacterium]|jgi:CheY-like chemotaxis protein|nr:response regulator [Spirochaetaceae bacterium]
MGKQKILIIDDEQINLDFFDVMLTRLGFEVHLSTDGEDGLNKIQEVNPNLIILDNIMPRLTGWELTRLLKKDETYSAFSDIPIIMFSAMDAVKDKIEGFELGIDDYITKPYNFSEVLARIRAVLRNRELSQQIVLREKMLSTADSLNQSFIYFTDHLRAPVVELLSMAQSMDSNDAPPMDSFIEKVKDECSSVLAAMDGLKEEVDELKSSKTENIKSFSLQEMDEKFHQHLKSLQESEEA